MEIREAIERYIPFNEQEAADKEAEESRIAELKAICEKKGLNFEEEEAKYQAKLAAKSAKEQKSRKK